MRTTTIVLALVLGTSALALVPSASAAVYVCASNPLIITPYWGECGGEDAWVQVEGFGLCVNTRWGDGSDFRCGAGGGLLGPIDFAP